MYTNHNRVHVRTNIIKRGPVKSSTASQPIMSNIFVIIPFYYVMYVYMHYCYDYRLSIDYLPLHTMMPPSYDFFLSL